MWNYPFKVLWHNCKEFLFCAFSPGDLLNLSTHSSAADGTVAEIASQPNWRVNRWTQILANTCVCVCVCVCVLLFMGSGSRRWSNSREGWRRAEQTLFWEGGREEDLWCWMGLQKMKEKRKLWGEREGKQSWMYCGGWFGGGGGWEPGGGRGGAAPCENESVSGDCAWEGCWEDAHDCFKVPPDIVHEPGSETLTDTESAPLWRKETLVFLGKQTILFFAHLRSTWAGLKQWSSFWTQTVYRCLFKSRGIFSAGFLATSSAQVFLLLCRIPASVKNFSPQREWIAVPPPPPPPPPLRPRPVSQPLTFENGQWGDRLYCVRERGERRLPRRQQQCT